MADPFLLLVLGQGQQEHVPGRGHIVVYCREQNMLYRSGMDYCKRGPKTVLQVRGGPYNTRHLFYPNNNIKPKRSAQS